MYILNYIQIGRDERGRQNFVKVERDIDLMRQMFGDDKRCVIKYNTISE